MDSPKSQKSIPMKTLLMENPYHTPWKRSCFSQGQVVQICPQIYRIVPQFIIKEINSRSVAFYKIIICRANLCSSIEISFTLSKIQAMQKFLTDCFLPVSKESAVQTLQP